MSDFIDRQAAIDAVHEEFDDCLVWDESGKRTADEFETIINQLPSAQPEPKWIPVTERLPKPVAPSQRREWFITSNQYGGVTLTCYEFSASPFKEGWQTDMTILAWMPLPEPYREADMR